MRTVDKGSAGEMLVCADLLDRGFAAFRTTSQTSPFDVVAYKDGVFLAIEVKRGMNFTTQVSLTYKFRKFHVLAEVKKNKEIVYHRVEGSPMEGPVVVELCGECNDL